MKKNMMLLLSIIILFFNLGLAQNPNGEPINWNDPENFKENFATHPAEAFSSNPNEAWSSLESDPSLLTNPNILEAAFNQPDYERAVNILETNSHLMKDENIFRAVNEKSIGNTILLKTHPKVQGEWFNHFGIVDEGAELESYDGVIVKTVGNPDKLKGVDRRKAEELATTFNIHQHPGAKVLPTGELLDAQGAVISGGVVTKEGTTTKIEGGRVDFSNSRERGTYQSKGGEFWFKDMVIFGEDISAETKNGALAVKGTGVSVEDYDRGWNKRTKAAAFTGTLTFEKDFSKENMHLTLGKDSEMFVNTKKGQPAFSFKVTQDTAYYDSPSFCSLEKGSCIGYNNFEEGTIKENRLRVVAKSNNQIKVNVVQPREGVEALKGGKFKFSEVEVALITDNSQVNINDQMIVSKKAVKTTDPSQLQELSERIDVFSPGKDGTICLQSYGSAKQSCMTKFEYDSLQETRAIKERHRASIATKGIGTFYGSEWWEYTLNGARNKNERIKELRDDIKLFEETKNSLLEQIKVAQQQGENTQKFREALDINKANLEYAHSQLQTIQTVTAEGGPRVSSCIGLVKEVADSWPSGTARSAVVSSMKQHDAKASYVMQDLVKKAGWEAYFYAPDTINPAEIQEEEKDYHRNLYERTSQSGRYNIPGAPISIPIKEEVVNYRPSKYSQAEGIITETEDLEKVGILQEIPFAIGESRYGRHTYVLSRGNIYQIHYSDEPQNPELVDSVDFKNRWDWLSGVFVAPPGAWERAKTNYCNNNPSAMVCQKKVASR